MRDKADQAKVCLRTNGDIESAYVIGIKILIAKAIRNILDNAIRFSHKGNDIIISIGKTPTNGMEILVKDGGCGIPSNYIPRIGELFSQADQSDTRLHDGLGIGFALAKRYMQYHDGDIRVIETSAMGTIIGITIPAIRLI